MMDKQIAMYENNSISIFGDANIMRGAELLAQSDIIPQAFRGKPANVLVAMDMAQRLNASPMLVMQNLYVIQGKPSWSSQYLIAMINRSGRFSSPLQFDFERGADGKATACRAWAIDGATGARIDGVTVTMEMAKAEGWISKAGSKWQTMPELMLQYRAAAFFARTICPDLTMGLYTEYEQREITESDPAPVQYEDKTEPEPKEEPKPAYESPAVRFYKRALSEVGGDKDAAAKLCTAALNRIGISRQEMTEENFGAVIQAMIGVLADEAKEPETETTAETDDAPF